MKNLFIAGLFLTVFAYSVFAFEPFQTAPRPSAARGKKIYETHCLSCHQEDGSGVPNMNPPLIKTSYVLGDRTRLIQIVLHGFNEQVEINGAYYSNPMPAFGALLNDQQVSDVLTYVRSNFGNKAGMVTAEQVKAVRGTKH